MKKLTKNPSNPKPNSNNFIQIHKKKLSSIPNQPNPSLPHKPQAQAQTQTQTPNHLQTL